MRCIQCNQEHERKGIYCSKKCTDKAYRERKKDKTISSPIIEKVCEDIVIPKQTGTKLKWCNYCGNSIEHSDRLQFCNDEHENNFMDAIKKGRPLKIRIDASTIIETKKYDKVQETIEKFNQNKFGFYFGRKLGL